MDLVLIDTQWNVNKDWRGDFLAKFNVLIDTQWNVNGTQAAVRKLLDIVLIDTQWNVNDNIDKKVDKFFLF